MNTLSITVKELKQRIAIFANASVIVADSDFNVFHAYIYRAGSKDTCYLVTDKQWRTEAQALAFCKRLGIGEYK